MNDSDAPTETIAFRMMLKPGALPEYRRRHDEIWPELADALRQAGVIDYRIFHDGPADALFAVMTRRVDHGLDDLRRSPLMARWWERMSDICVTLPSGVPAEQALEPAFTLAPD